MYIIVFFGREFVMYREKNYDQILFFHENILDN